MGPRRAQDLTAAALAALLLAVACVALLAGCGDATTAGDEFEPAPSAAPGVYAWAVGEEGAVLFTPDGGASWERRSFGLSARGADIDFTDASHGWLVTDEGTVLSTANGGVKWSVEKETELDLIAVASVDADHVWALGGSEDSLTGSQRSSILRSDDGGRTWSSRSFDNVALADVVFADARRGWLVALDRIWTTRDGGATWRLSTRRGMAVLKSVACSDRRHAWVVGWGTQDGAPLVLSTSDGGATWRESKVGLVASGSTSLQPERVACFGGQTVWITCAAGIIATTDGGRAWELQEVPMDAQSVGIAAADSRHVLATTKGQPILATGDGGAGWRACGRPGWLKTALTGISAVKASGTE